MDKAVEHEGGRPVGPEGLLLLAEPPVGLGEEAERLVRAQPLNPFVPLGFAVLSKLNTYGLIGTASE